jgi:hypothetical protein
MFVFPNSSGAGRGTARDCDAGKQYGGYKLFRFQKNLFYKLQKKMLMTLLFMMTIVPSNDFTHTQIFLRGPIKADKDHLIIQS